MPQSTQQTEWREISLTEVIELIGGGTPKTTNPDFWKGSIPWLSVVDFNNDSRWVSNTEKHITNKGLENSSTKLLKKGDLVISARGTVGALTQLAKPMAFNQSCYGIRAVEKLAENDFIYYLLKFTVRELSKHVHGAVFDTITRETFTNIIILLPPLPEQRAIAAVLSSLDDKIELLRKQNETLESMAQALFKEWFVDFNFPNKEGKPYKKSGGKMVESELGGIPEKWISVKVSEIIEFNPREKINYDKEYLFFDMKTLSENSISMYPGVWKKSKSASNFRQYDTLLAKITPCLENGKTGFVFNVKGEDIARGSTEFIVMRESERSNPYFIYCLARSEKFRDYAIKSMTGTSGRQRVQIDVLKKYLVAYEQSTMKLFKTVCKPLFMKINNNRSQIQTLSSLRDALLPKLMRGEVRVETSSYETEK